MIFNPESKMKSAKEKRLIVAATADFSARQRRDLKLQGLSSVYRSQLSGAYSGEVSPSDAIAAKCRDCVCYENTVSEIKNCTSYTCPLWAYRPYTD